MAIHNKGSFQAKRIQDVYSQFCPCVRILWGHRFERLVASSSFLSNKTQKQANRTANINIFSGDSQLEIPIIMEDCIILYHDDEHHLNYYKHASLYL